MKISFRAVAAAGACLLVSASALAQNAGTLSNHAFAIGKGAGQTGFTSLPCGAGTIPIGQAGADPICQSISGDITISAAGAAAIGVTVVHSAMLNADVFSTVHSWSATQAFPNNSLTLAEFPTLGANTVIGSVAGGTPAALSQAQITAMINLATASLAGALPAWPNNTTTYFRGDGTYAAVPFSVLSGSAACGQLPALTGDLTTVAGSCATTIPTNTVTNTKAAQMAAGTVKGNPTGSTANAQDVAPAAARSSSLLNVDSFTGHGDSIYTILATDRTVGTNAAFTASRTWILPAANAVNPGQEIVVADFQGTVTGVNTLVISRAGSDTVNGVASVTMSSANGAYLFKSDGASKWTAQALGAAAAGGVSSVTCGTGLSGGTITTSGTCAVNLPTLSNSIGADVLLNNIANFFDGPSVAQGTSGKWSATGSVTVRDTAGLAGIVCKLWDGTTVIDSRAATVPQAGNYQAMTFSGTLASPAGNIRISCKDLSSTSGFIIFNVSGAGKDSSLTVTQVQ